MKAYFYLTIAALAWGGNAVAGKLAVGHISPMMLTSWRWTVALAVIAIVSVPQVKKDWLLIRKCWPLLIAYGAVGYTSFNALLYTSLQYTTAINVAIEQAGIPMLIFIFNFLLFRLPVSQAQIAGFALTLTGVALTAAHGELSTLLQLTLNRGDVLMLLAVLAYALYTVALRFKPPIGWKSLMAVPVFGALVASFPLLGWEAMEGKTLWPDAQGWSIVLYTGLFASLLAQILFIRGVEVIGPNRAGLFINLVPVFGTLLSVAMIGEALQTFHALALTLALGGIAIAEKGRFA